MTNECEVMGLGKEAWVEPRIVQLDVNETAHDPGTGADGGSADNSAS
jgi:hypothetical protein